MYNCAAKEDPNVYRDRDDHVFINDEHSLHIQLSECRPKAAARPVLVPTEV